MIGKSEEKLRPKSIFWRRVIAKYVLWVEVAGYLLVIALFAGLVYAMTIKAEDEFLDIPGDINLAAEVLHAQGNAVVTSILPRAARPGFLLKPRQTALKEAFSPHAHHLAARAQARGNLIIAQPLGGGRIILARRT